MHSFFFFFFFFCYPPLLRLLVVIIVKFFLHWLKAIIRIKWYRYRQAAKIYVATSYSVIRQETIEISEQRTAFVWFFAQEVDWCMKDCDKQRLQTTVSINLRKILAGHTGDWLDIKTASICTTELWDAMKSFILSSLKFKVAPYPIIVSLDTLSSLLMHLLQGKNFSCPEFS